MENRASSISPTFYEELLFLRDFLKRNVISPPQRIMLKTKASNLIYYYNELISSDSPPTELFQYFLNAITIFEEIFVLYQKHQEKDDLIFFELYSLYLLIISQLTIFYGEDGSLQNVGTAYILINILSGTQMINPLPFLVERNHPDYVSRYSIVFNVLNSQYNLFSQAIRIVYDISYHDLLIWAKNALESAYHLSHLLDWQWNVSHIYSITKNNTTKRPFFLFIFHVLFPLELADFILYLKGVLNREWPVQLHDTPFHLTSNEDVNNLLEELYLNSQRKYKELVSYQEKRIFNPNDHFYEDKDIKNIKDTIDYYNIVIPSYLEMEKALDGVSNETLLLGSKIKDIISYLKQHQDEFTPNFFHTMNGEETLKQVKHFISIYAFYYNYVSKNDFPQFHELIQPFNTPDVIQKYPDIAGIDLMLWLIHSLHHQEHMNLKAIEKQAQAISNAFTFKYRDSLSFLLLKLFIQIYLGEQRIDNLTNVFRHLEQKLIDVGNEKMLNELQSHLSLILDILKGKEGQCDMGRVTSPNPYDPYSFLIPDFAALSKNRDLPVLMWLPFNLLTDKIRLKK